MKTLMIAPHFDDESISCGGLLAQRARTGGDVQVLAIHGRHYGNVSLKQQALSDAVEYQDFEYACRQLVVTRWKALLMREGEPMTIGYYDLLESIERVLCDFQPDEVIVPSADDLNQDHRHLNHVCRIALRPINLRNVRRVLEFIGLDGRLRQPTYYVPLTRSDLELKLRAINCYRRERRELPSPRAPANVEAQARVWGAVAGVEFAEAYTVYMERE